MKYKFQIVSVLLTVVLLMSAFATQVAAGQRVLAGKKVGLERQGNYFLLPTADGNEKVSIEEFQVEQVAGQLMLLTSVNLLVKERLTVYWRYS